MLHTSLLKSVMVHSRSVCSLPPCSDRHGYPLRRRSRNTWSHLSWDATKMMILPCSYHSPSSSSMRRKRSSSGRISTTCSMSLFTTERPPTWISTGLFSARRASASMACGKVAENMTVCLSGRRLFMMRVICGSNPMSNIRSASSSTMYVIRRRLVIRPAPVVSRSIMRPGVHATISQPRFSSPICAATPLPPYTLTATMPTVRPNFLQSLPICVTSSRVGPMIIPMGPSPCSVGAWSLMCRSIGRTYAKVFPEPVLATPMQSRPDMITGSAWHWIGMGFSKPLRRISSITRLLRPACAQDLMGRGTSLPRHLMPSSSVRRSRTSSLVMRAISYDSM
mmetsp:Transcript_27462/g.67484  ORF Transcript_27462/g.67484 Transcript_27462/m.67484 type:complete len:337 (+) Transcript_27462:558-1568(+)